jgi:hypothetical protein
MLHDQFGRLALARSTDLDGDLRAEIGEQTTIRLLYCKLLLSLAHVRLAMSIRLRKGFSTYRLIGIDAGRGSDKDQ